jgi:tetratricopeptide (TPR) repeat protein
LLLAQNNNGSKIQTTDSLKTLIKNATTDTTRLNLLLELVGHTPDELVWPKYNEEALQIARKLLASDEETLIRSGKIGIASVYNNQAFLYSQYGNTSKALEIWGKSAELLDELGDKQNMANVLSNMATVYNSQGNVPKALDYSARALHIQEQYNNKEGMALSLNVIGYIYNKQGDLKNALIYFLRSLQLQTEIKNNSGIAKMLNNIGAIYFLQGKKDLALDAFSKSLKLQKEEGRQSDAGISLNNIGTIYSSMNQFEKGLTYYQEGLKINKEIGNKQGCADLYLGIATVYLKQKKIGQAQSYCDSSLSLAKTLGFPLQLSKSELLASKIDSCLGKFAGAFEHFKQFIIYRDSVKNETTRKASIKNLLNYEFEKKEAVMKEQQEKERAVAKEKDRFQQIIIWCVIIGLLLVVVFVLFVFRSLKVTKQQKHIIEEKQKEILDSIRYAKRIQTSLLPTEKYIERIINTSKK